MTKKWIFSNEQTNNENIVELLLKKRAVEDIDLFLKPPSALSWVKTFSPKLKQSLAKAKELITDAIEKNTPIVVHGDYDADGICATAILFSTIKNELGYENCFSFIPNRFDHGYGLSTESIDAVVEKLGKPKKLLFITVDSGITATQEVEYIKSLGYKIIITDHHQKSSELPNADCIVWDDQIVGTGIAWFLARVLGSKDSQSVALAALATVTDLQPLLNANRSIVKEGLQVLNTNPPLGLKKLLQASGRREGEVTTYDLGWVLGPRINASGRLVDASEPLLLLLEKNEAVAETIAQKLNTINTERQDKTIEMYAIADVSQDKELPKIIISSHADYHEGIIGLVAARLAQKYYRPSIVISLTEEYGKGSVRSVPGIDIISVLRQFENLFTSLGGHPMAAGFTIHKDNIATLRERLNEYSLTAITDEMLEPTLEIDLKIPLNLITLETAESLNKMKPFGIGNKEPLFMSENVGISGINTVGKEGNHLSLRLFAGGSYYKAIFFGGAVDNASLKTGDVIDIVYKIKESEYNGNKKVDIIIEDLRKGI